MKYVLSLVLIINSFYSNAQIEYGYSGLLSHDSCNFNSSWSRLKIDLTNTNNDWVIGSTNKPFFGQANSLPNAIMTDSLNPYSPNNLSYFDIGFSAWDGSGFPYNMYIQFDHKYETDTLVDGGFITLSYDSGQTWVNAINDSSSVVLFNWPYINAQNLYTISDTLINGNFGYSGTSDWKTTILQWIWALPVKYISTDSLIIRFNFISDGNQTNKDGWIIDNIVVGDVDMGSSIQENKNAFESSIFPNITSNYFQFKTSVGKPIDLIEITSIAGVKCISIANPNPEEKISIINLPSGIYFVTLLSKGKYSTNKLIINKE